MSAAPRSLVDLSLIPRHNWQTYAGIFRRAAEDLRSLGYADRADRCEYHAARLEQSIAQRHLVSDLYMAALDWRAPREPVQHAGDDLADVDQPAVLMGPSPMSHGAPVAEVAA